MFALGKNSTSLRMIIQRAKGSWLWDINNKKYLDAFSSYSSANFGHQHPFLHQRLIQQTHKVSVYSRTLTSDVLLSLCELIHNLYSEHITGNELRVIPMNSGVEAGETAVKFARKWGYLTKKIPIGEAKVLFANNNYWGKTISAISTSDYDYQKYFFPTTPGFLKVPFNDSASIESALSNDPTITAVYLEPVQGEGGINVPSLNYFREVRDICTKHNVLLIADEIQTGMGRTGSALCIQDYGIQADIILLGKSLGGGFLPISTCITRADVADLVNPGEHSSTFGGYPLGCAMAVASLQLLHHTPLLSEIKEKTLLLQIILSHLKTSFPDLIEEVRGKGMLCGIRMKDEIDPLLVCDRLTDFGLVTREANHHVVRICPPLTSTISELEYLGENLHRGLRSIQIKPL